MADISSPQWSEQASGNSAAPPDGAPENMPRAAVNDTMREMMAAIKREWNRSHFTQGTQGTGLAYTLTYDAAPPGYTQGLTVATLAHTPSLNSPTLNINNLGAKRLRRSTRDGFTDIRAGHIHGGQFITCVFDVGQDCWFVTSPFPHLDRYIVGQIIDYPGDGVPQGFLPADGRTVSRAAYADLFAAIGTKYGAGDGFTTFVIPDRRGRVPVGGDAMGGFAAGRVTPNGSGIDGAAIGATGGSQLTQAHNHLLRDPGHGHAVADFGHTHLFLDPGHNHGLSDPGHSHGVSDPGHGHAVPTPGPANAFQDPQAQALFGDTPTFRGAGTAVSTTGIAIQGSGTGMTIAGSRTGAAIEGSKANIGIFASGTDISIDPAFAGQSQNMPPCQVTNMLIYTGIF